MVNLFCLVIASFSAKQSVSSREVMFKLIAINQTDYFAEKARNDKAEENSITISSIKQIASLKKLAMTRQRKARNDKAEKGS